MMADGREVIGWSSQPRTNAIYDPKPPLTCLDRRNLLRCKCVLVVVDARLGSAEISKNEETRENECNNWSLYHAAILLAGCRDTPTRPILSRRASSAVGVKG
jgi:hypothetical protein